MAGPPNTEKCYARLGDRALPLLDLSLSPRWHLPSAHAMGGKGQWHIGGSVWPSSVERSLCSLFLQKNLNRFGLVEAQESVSMAAD